MRLPPGLIYAEEAVSPDDERALIKLIENSGLTYPPYDPGNRRSSTAYGWDYDYINDAFMKCEPMPDGFLAVRKIAARQAGIELDLFAECLLNRYEPGAIIQRHLDKPVWNHVAGVSLGGTSTMVFEKDDDSDRIEVVLKPRSIYAMTGDARYRYTHELLPSEETRWSITFRSLSKLGERQRDNILAASGAGAG